MINERSVGRELDGLASALASYVAHDNERKNELVTFAQTIAFNALRAKLRPPHDSALHDVVQHTLIRISQILDQGGTFASPPHFVALVSRVAAGCRVDYFRSWKRRGGTVEITEVPDCNKKNDFTKLVETQEIVEKMLAGLDEREKAIATGIAEGRTNEEIARELGLSTSMIKKLRAKLLNNLRVLWIKLTGTLVSVSILLKVTLWATS